MATYTVTGHPLNYQELNMPHLQAQLLTSGVGASITLTLSGPEDTKAKGHAVVK